MNHETVLFVVTGMSPAILTETVWALAHESTPVIPSRVVALTTLKGRAAIRRQLLTQEGGKPSIWERLRKALDSKKAPIGNCLQFGDTADDIRVFTQRQTNGLNVELDDIRTPEDNEAMADFILTHLRSFTENPDVRIIASIAGGRKTMGALMYACMTLLGREQDRITHVLVGAPFDDPRHTPPFFFPSTTAERKADIQLADIPFVPIRNCFQDLGRLPGNFSTLVRHYSRRAPADLGRPVELRLYPDEPKIIVDGLVIQTGPRTILALHYLVHLNANGAPDEMQRTAALKFPDFIRAQSGRLAKLVAPTLGNAEAESDLLKRELSELRKKLKEAGCIWQPGTRSKSLILPAFRLNA